MAIIIKNFIENDIESILKIQKETNLSPWKDKDYLKELDREDSVCKTAILNEAIVGFAVLRLLANENNLFDSAEILNIAVSTSFQNKGIGQKLFDKIKIELKEKNVSEIWLEVRESNKKAIRFYMKNGFAKQFVRKNYYADPTEDAFILNNVSST